MMACNANLIPNAARRPQRIDRMLGRLALFMSLLLAQPLAAETLWEMSTEYPASAIPGQGVAGFAALVHQKTGGALVVKTGFDAANGIKSAGMLEAVRDGRLQAGDAFAGALDAVDPVFALSSLPFLATSIPDAKRLTDIARPAYEAVLARMGQRLLYTTPWPPSGIWSKRALASPADLRTLTIRTYDDTSTLVMQAAGARATAISFADAMPKLRDGSVDAVLSSGDGGAGRKLWELLPHFTEINYAMPISVATVSLTALQALPGDLQEAVLAAGRETEALQWAAIQTRQAENHARIQANGVTLNLKPDPAMMSALMAGAAPAQEAWAKRAGSDNAALLTRFRAGQP
jgi:TRAP-type C4-dicarboxylate transport system substrate-binding protein